MNYDDLQKLNNKQIYSFIVSVWDLLIFVYLLKNIELWDVKHVVWHDLQMQNYNKKLAFIM